MGQVRHLIARAAETQRAVIRTFNCTASDTSGWPPFHLRAAAVRRAAVMENIMKFYLLVDGLNGGITDPGFVGAFALPAFNFDIGNVISGGAAGGGSGKVVLSPVNVALPAGTSSTALLNTAALGAHTGAMQIIGVDDSGETVYDLRLNDVTVQGLHDQAGGSTLQLDYGAISLTTRDQLRDGTLAAPTTFSFDVADNRPGTTPIEAAHPGSEPAATPATKFYLAIDGLNGGSTDADHLGWFAVGNFALDVSDLTAGSGGAGAGKVSFAPLTVDLPADGALTALLADAARGSHLTSVELEGVTADGTVVYDMKLGGVGVQDVRDAATSNGESLAFTFSQIALDTKAVQADGSVVPAGSFSRDIAKGSPQVSIPDPTIGAAPTGSAAAHYYLVLDGLNGGVTDPGFVGAFQLDDFSFDIGNITSGTGGGSIGKATLSDILLKLALDPAAGALLGDAIRGGVIDAAQVVGVNDAGQTVYDLRLSHVLVTDAREGPDGSHDVLQLDYDKISLTTRASDNGTLSQPSTFSFDKTTQRTGTTELAAPHAGTTPAATPATKFFLAIDGLKGGVTDSGHVGWFAVSDFDLDISNLPGVDSNGHVVTGKIDASPLTVDLALDGALTALLADAARSSHIASIKLEGVSATGKMVYDLSLGNVTVQDVHDGSSAGNNSVVFDYDQIALQTQGAQSDGTVVPSTSFSRDIATGTNDIIIADPKVGGVATGAAVTHYYLLLDGMNGGVTAKGLAGAFNLDGFSLDLGNTTTVGTGGGGAGKATHTPLTLDLALDPDLAALLDTGISGRFIDAAEIVGVNGNGQTVYDLRLADALLKDVHEQAGGGNDALQLDYRAISLTTRPQNGGKLGTATTFSFDAATNTTGTTPLAAAKPGSGPAAASATKFFLAIDGLHGDATDAAHLGWFAVDDFLLDVSNAGSALDNAGKPSVGPLTIDLPLTGALTALLGEAAAASSITSIKLEGVNADGQAVYDLKLGGVTVQDVHDGSNNADDSLAFTFKQISLYTRAADGKAGPGFALDVAAGSEGASIPDPRVAGNHAPVTADDVVSVKPGGKLNVDAAHGLLANAHDADHDALSVSAVAFGASGSAIAPGGSTTIQGAHGVLTLQSDGSYLYTASPSQSGFAEDSFVYTTSDGVGGTTQATLTVMTTRGQLMVGAPGDRLAGGNGAQVLDGSLGHQTLDGGNGRDVLIGGDGDTLTGGRGADTFVFRAGFGHETITDLDPQRDLIQFENGLFASADDVLQHVASDGHGGSVITLDDADSIALSGVAPAQLHAHDFLIG